ncbi:MAG: alpha/beta fold hydrolase [Rhizobium sp.]|nr:alpha/beta fold hydrolase [Rhizobium sp.]
MTLFAEVRHSSSAKAPLVLLHGFGGIGAVWEPVIRRLDPDLPLVLYDLPGHGRSLDAEGVGNAGVMARAILDDLDRRGISSFHLCGHSMGGAIAGLIALKAADRVRSLTLVAPGGFGPDINHEALRRYGSADDLDALSAAIAAMVAPGHAPERSGLSGLVQARRLPGAVDRLMTILKSFLIERDGLMGQGTLPFSAFAGCAVPTRLLWGTEDPILPVLQAQNIWAGAELTLIEDAGHMLIEEAPDQVASAIHALLAKD